MRSIQKVVGRWVPDPWLTWWGGFDRWLQRAMTGILGIVVLVVVLSVLYHTIMIRFEGRSPTFGHSVQVVVETFTGTGYGSDSPWETPVANAFVTAMDLSTFLVLFIVFPYVFQPVLESALAPTVPTTYEADGHVVVCGVPRLTDRLVTEFADRETDVVVVAADRDDVLALRDDGIAAIHGDPTSAGTLRQTSVDTARAAVVDTGDERAASVVLAVRETDSDVRTVVVVDHLDHEPQLRHAGVDSVITPRQLLGRRLAERVQRELDPASSDTVRLDDDSPDGPGVPVGERLDDHVRDSSLPALLGWKPDVDPVFAFVDWIRHHTVVEVARGFARQRVEIPAVSRTPQEAVLDRALAEGPALMGAVVVEGGVLTFMVSDCDGGPAGTAGR